MPLPMSAPSPSTPPAAQTLPAASSPRPRMEWMDLLRGTAVLLVVVLHAATIPASTGDAIRDWVLINRYVEPFRMPMLMLLSGMLLPMSLAKPPAQYLWGKVSAIAWPAAVWLLLHGVLVHRNGPGDLAYWATGDYLWFLLALLVCYAGALALRRVPFVGVAALMMLLVTTVEVPGGLVMKTLYYGAFFFLGAGLGRLIPRWLRVPWPAAAVLAVAAGVLSHLGLEDQRLRLGTLEAAGISVLGLLVILWIAPRLPIGGLARFLRWIGRSSIVVYVAHFPILILIHRGMERLGADPVWHVGVTTVVGLALTVLMVALRPWTPWLYVAPGARRVAEQLRTRAGHEQGGRHRSGQDQTGQDQAGQDRSGGDRATNADVRARR